MIPYSGGRVAFIHQSVTEYLAATEIARRLQAQPESLREKLKYRRWDQVLFLTLILLPDDQCQQLFEEIINSDFLFALEASKYLETDREYFVTRLLEVLPSHIEAEGLFTRTGMSIIRCLEWDLPILPVHEAQLRKLIELGDLVGGAAATRLLTLRGAEVKEELLRMIAEHPGDYNFCCTGLSQALRGFVEAEDIEQIKDWADSLSRNAAYAPEKGEWSTFARAAAIILSGLDFNVVRTQFPVTADSTKSSPVRASILCELAVEEASTSALELLGELLLNGISEAATQIYFLGRWPKKPSDLSWESFSNSHVDQLIDDLKILKESWALRALSCLSTVRPDLGDTLRARALEHNSFLEAVLLYSATPGELQPVFEALQSYLCMTEEERSKELLHVLREVDFDWSGQEELLLDLLRLRDIALARVILPDGFPPEIRFNSKLAIGSIAWWLDWLDSMLVSERSTDAYWVSHQVGSLLAEHATKEVIGEFITEFNRPDSRYRKVLLRVILPRVSEVTTDVLGKDAVSFVLADLNREDFEADLAGPFLGKVATELFVTEQLLPLLPSAKGTLRKNLHLVLAEAGARHGRRYDLDQAD